MAPLSKKKKDNKPFNVIILGDPASGKGTQSARLAREYGMYDLDMGREVKKPENLKLYDYAHTTAIGKLTPTAVARKIFKDKIGRTPAHKGIVFSGTPKMINEAKLVERLLRKAKRSDPLFLYLSIPLSETIRRMHSRHEYVNGKKVRRDDDNERALKNRRKYYREQVSHVVKFFNERYEHKRVSGMGTKEEVSARVESALAQHLKKLERK